MTPGQLYLIAVNSQASEMTFNLTPLKARRNAWAYGLEPDNNGGFIGPSISYAENVLMSGIDEAARIDDVTFDHMAEWLMRNEAAK